MCLFIPSGRVREPRKMYCLVGDMLKFCGPLTVIVCVANDVLYGVHWR